MNLKDLEKHINSSFGNYKPKTSDDKIWSAIESSIPARKNKRRGFFWLWFGLGSLLGLAAIVFLWNIDGSELPTEEFSISNTPIELQSSETTIESDVEIKDLTESSTEVNESINESLSEAYISTSNERNSEIKSTVTLQQKSASRTLINSIFNNENTLEETKAQTLEPTLKLALPITGNYMPQVLDRMTLLEDKIKLALASNSLDSKIAIDLPLAVMKTDKVYSLQSDLQFTSSILLSKLNIENINADPDLFQKRLDAENVYENIQFSIKYSREVLDRLFLNLGLSYNFLQHSSRHRKSEVEYIEQSFNSIKRIKNTDIIRYGSDHSIYMPLQVGYRFMDRSKLSLGVTVGYDYNIWSKKSGFEIDLDETEYDLSLDIEDRIRKRNSDYLTAGLLLNYNISEAYNLLFGVEARQGRHNVYTEQVGINKTYDFIGLNIGFSRKFK